MPARGFDRRGILCAFRLRCAITDYADDACVTGATRRICSDSRRDLLRQLGGSQARLGFAHRDGRIRVKRGNADEGDADHQQCDEDLDEREAALLA